MGGEGPGVFVSPPLLRVRFKKPTVVGFKNPTSPVFRVRLHAPLFIYLFQDPLSGVLKTEFETPTLPKYQVGGNPSEDIQVKTN